MSEIILKCLEMPKVVILKVCMYDGYGAEANLYSIGGDPLTQLNVLDYIFWKKFLLQKKR